METGAPYYVLNIDTTSGRSDVVTAGSRAAIDTIYVSRNADVTGLGSEVDACITLARELEGLLQVDNLDIEFGIDRAGRVFLFQVRPIATRARKFELADDDLERELEQIREFLEVHFRAHPALAGKTTVLGTMPDWNPAEMIGTAPRPLALSLYQTLVGRSAWSAARALVGYREVRPEPLIVSLGGRPFVDVRASLNSFLPAGLDDETAETWVNHGLRMLQENSRLHDKLEFEVAITCFTFDFDDHAQRLRDAHLDENAIADFRQRVLELTRAVLCDEVASIDSQLARLDELTRRRQRWLDDTSPSMHALARRIQALVADCEEYGVVPFSVMARYAFMAMSLLRSLRSVGVFSDDEYQTILSSIPTVASELSRDMWRHATGRLSTDSFLARFGHLRPSSYDINSPNYSSANHLLKVGVNNSGTEPPFPDISVAEEMFDARTTEIDALLRECGLLVTARQLRSFVMRSIPGREWAKFEFMKSVDAALEAIAQLGEGLGFSREEMSFLPVDAVLRGALDSSSGAVYMEFRRQIDFRMKRWNMTCALRLPHLVRSTADVSGFRQETWTPNFISTQRVVAEPVVLESGASGAVLEGRIVLIRAADPGYDWIFSQPIAGLITAYGGVASHMAIRAAEFGLPAAIGCGDLVFDSLGSARLVDLDCATERVLPLP
jgi:phosphohistidine swiveling domain-containing protein